MGVKFLQDLPEGKDSREISCRILNGFFTSFRHKSVVCNTKSSPEVL